MVLRLVEPFVGKGRHVTTDYFFTSLPLAKALLSKNTSIVGTIKRKERELSVYQCKARRNVNFLSTQHQHVAISTERKGKPETVDYNHSKVEVDVLDQMARQYSVKGIIVIIIITIISIYNTFNMLGVHIMCHAYMARCCVLQCAVPELHEPEHTEKGLHASALSGWHQKCHHLRTCPSAVQKSAGE
ncbi:hypothetical protein KUCAC02_015742 [Chaenocephalus aceratus]|uniref:Uncharacterized protein n=1 Tax=Chaenocephalus aceratus TaxID=36190 RepID=A0ACB9Y0Q2_CHAAC|nr:hypothetical protein KUCAC02_015742 [Chaenocephalus aceratus]